jgi:hypothetical protein
MGVESTNIPSVALGTKSYWPSLWRISLLFREIEGFVGRYFSHNGRLSMTNDQIPMTNVSIPGFLLVIGIGTLDISQRS